MGVDSISVVYGPTTVVAGTKVSIVGTTNTSLAGKTAYILKLNDGAPVILAKGQSVDSAGLIKTWAQLQRTGVLQLVVPASTTALTGAAPNSVGTWPWDPNTPLLAKSAEFTITVTK